jgi:glycosyltransferase involved in cell wall biosynthesis
VFASDTDAGFADALVALLRDGRRAQELAERGKDWVRREFDWSRLVEQTEAVYRRVSDARAPG